MATTYTPRFSSRGATLKGILITVVIIAGLGAFRSFNKSWDTVEERSVTIGASEAWVMDFTMKRSADIRVTATEASSKPITVFWLTGNDHRFIQNNDQNMMQALSEGDESFIAKNEELVARMERQTLFVGPNTKSGEVKVPAGEVYLYFEAIEDEQTKIDYKVQVYQ